MTIYRERIYSLARTVRREVLLYAGGALLLLAVSNASGQTSEIVEQLTLAIERQLVPPPLADWPDYLTEEQSMVFVPSGAAALAWEEARQKFVKAIDATKIDLVSATFVGSHAIVIARVTIQFKAESGIETDAAFDRTLRIFRFIRGDRGWLQEAPSIEYRDRFFEKLHSDILKEHAMLREDLGVLERDRAALLARRLPRRHARRHRGHPVARSSAVRRPPVGDEPVDVAPRHVVAVRERDEG